MAGASELVFDVMASGLEHLYEGRSVNAAMAYGDLLAEEFVRAAAISGDIEEDDFERVKK